MARSPAHHEQSVEATAHAPRLMAAQLGILAVCLLSLYVVVVLAAILPTALLDPAWQLRFTNALIVNGFLALLGLALVHLAAYLDPANPHLGRRRNDFATWALIPVLGFLLLIPLQGYAVWRGIGTAKMEQNNQLRQVTGRISALREAINTSTNTQDLQRRWQALKAPPLRPTDLTQPWPQLRNGLLESLEQMEIRAGDRLKGIQPSVLWQITQGSIGTVLSAFVLVVGFASFTKRKGRERTLLQQWQDKFQSRRGSAGFRLSQRTTR